jgi:hypothetical protein
MLMRGSSTWWADPIACLSGGILKRLQWRSPYDTAGGQTIFRVSPDVFISPSLRNLVARVFASADPLGVAVCDDDDAVAGANTESDLGQESDGRLIKPICYLKQTSSTSCVSCCLALLVPYQRLCAGFQERLHDAHCLGFII